MPKLRVGRFALPAEQDVEKLQTNRAVGVQLVGESDCHGYSGLPIVSLDQHGCGVLREAVREIKNHSVKRPNLAKQSFLLVKHPNPALPTVYLWAVGDIVLEDGTVGTVS